MLTTPRSCLARHRSERQTAGESIGSRLVDGCTEARASLPSGLSQFLRMADGSVTLALAFAASLVPRPGASVEDAHDRQETASLRHLAALARPVKLAGRGLERLRFQEQHPDTTTARGSPMTRCNDELTRRRALKAAGAVGAT